MRRGDNPAMVVNGGSSFVPKVYLIKKRAVFA
jgi:hypothetical protein